VIAANIGFKMPLQEASVGGDIGYEAVIDFTACDQVTVDPAAG
jgi:hypothetical protein